MFFFGLTWRDDRYDCNATILILHLSCTFVFVTHNNSRSFDNNFVCTSIALVCTYLFSHSSFIEQDNKTQPLHLKRVRVHSYLLA